MILTGKAKIAGVIGWPISHSLSPRLHGFWLDEYGIDGAYIPIAVSPENVTEVIRSLPKMGIAGINVTVPHKEAAFRAVDEADAVAQSMGAVNTIVVGADGKLTGSNTDGFGFMAHLGATVPGWTAGPVTVLGAGGAARGICRALIDAAVPEIQITNRTRARAETLADEFGDRVVVRDWDERNAALEGASLLVNTTTLGMAGADDLEIDLAALPTAAPVYDIVYTPRITPLLAQAGARGNPVIEGLGMLLHQARPGFAAWFGVEPEVTPALRDFVLESLA